jgi:hypothetical protein
MFLSERTVWRVLARARAMAAATTPATGPAQVGGEAARAAAG